MFAFLVTPQPWYLLPSLQIAIRAQEQGEKSLRARLCTGASKQALGN